jgi:DCN1-like protein 1/2
MFTILLPQSVSRDLWNQLWEFVRDVKPDFSNYDQVTGAWPSQIDLFVESMKAKGAKKAEEKDD